MDEYRAWVKARRKRCFRILAAVLCVCVLFTTYPDILTTFSVFAAQEKEEDFRYVTGFEELSEEIREQSVPVGTELAKLELPDTLEVYLSPRDEKQKGGGVKSSEDSDQKKKEDQDKPDEEEESGEEDEMEPGAGGEENPEEGEEGAGGEENPEEGEEGAGGEENPEEGEEGAGGEENPEEGEEGAGGEENPEEGEEGAGSEENPEEGEEDTGGKEESGAGDADSDDADEEEPDAGDQAVAVSNGIFVVPEYVAENVLTVQAGSFVMPEYGAENEMIVETLDEEEEESESGENDGDEKSFMIEGVTWESSPEYDGETVGVYVFTPILPESDMREEGVILPEEGLTFPRITVEVEEVFKAEQELTAEEYERMMAGIQDYPELLNEEDILEEAPELAEQAAGGPRRAAARAMETHPGTYLTTRDNENNAGTGKADGDIDEFLHQSNDNLLPIEANIFIPEGELPTRSCYVAVRAYDVDWQGTRYVDGKGVSWHCAEYDKVFVNGERVGTLTGLESEWNTAYYRVPVNCLREGKNTIRIEVWGFRCTTEEYMKNPNLFWSDNPPLDSSKVVDRNVVIDWGINVDWMQLVCDGGSREGIEEFSLMLTDAKKIGSGVAILGETVIKSTNAGASYDTEYSIMDSNGSIVGSYQEGNVSRGTQKFTVTIPFNSKAGTYTVWGMLKNKDGTVLAVDSMDFSYDGDGNMQLGPKMTHDLSPETWTKGNVVVTPKVANKTGYTDISISPKNITATQNGSYDFTVSYKTRSGAAQTMTYTVEVENIDREPPRIDYTPITVEPDATQAQVKQAVDEALTVTDNVTRECTVTYQLPTANELLDYEGRSVAVKVTAKDEVGNQSERICMVSVNTGPLALAPPTATRKGTTLKFTLSSKLTATGGKTVTENGFVWGTMQNPTIGLNQGSVKTYSTVKRRNISFTGQTTDIVEGVNYYVRAYVKADGVYYYSQPTGFNVGAKQYGTFTIKNNNDNTFTITRTGGSEGAQTVYYRTVNGSAIGGTHFEHKAGTIVFAAGDTAKTVSITENGVTSAYNNKTATAFSNADRTYQMEIYRVTGGGLLGTDNQTIATRTMKKDSAYTIDRSVYTKFRDLMVIRDETLVTDEGYSKGENRTTYTYMRDDEDGGMMSCYLMGTVTGWGMYLTLDMREEDNGYQWIKFTSSQGHVSEWRFEIKPGGTYKSWINNVHFPYSTNQGEVKNLGEWWATAEMPFVSNGNYLFIPASVTYMTIGRTAEGGGSDDWYFRNLKRWRKPFDEREPQLLGVAPMAAGSYKPGDRVTVSLVFDEIVDLQNSTQAGLDSLVAKTSWGDLTYAGGADTNVLYFTGIVPANASGTIQVTGITDAGKIKDMCDTSGSKTTGTGSTFVTVDTKVPTVSITQTALANGTASGTVTATNADTLQYTWSQDTMLPVTGWFTCTSGYTAKTNQTSGKWYLHALATYNGTGATAHTYKVFDFGTPENPVSPMPELTVSADNTKWAKSRSITVTRKPSGAAVKVTKPDKTTVSLTSSAKSYTVTANGLYTFTLTSGGETVVQDITVERIDRTAPTVTVTGAGSTSGIYHTLTMAADVADADSGVAKVEYVFSTGSATPSSGWLEAGNGSAGSTSEKLSDGRYGFTYTAAQTAQTKMYLHVRVTDLAGNITTGKSAAYTVIRETAAGQKPAVTLTAEGGTDWTKDDVTLTWKLTNAGSGTCRVNADNEWKGEQKVDATGTFAAEKNGVYMVSAVDENGDSADQICLVNNIDRDAPGLDELTVSPAGYAKEKTVTLAGATDNMTAQYDEKGVIGRSGSGIAAREYRLDEGEWQELAKDSFTVKKNGTYTVRLTDNLGNSAEYSVEVTDIDSTAPEMTCTVNAASNANSGWYISSVPVVLTFADIAGEEGAPSGVSTVEYKWVSDNAEKPTAGLSRLAASVIAKGTYTVSLPSNGIYYLYYKVTDKAGNVTDGFYGEIKRDAYSGSGTLSGPATGQPVSTGVTMHIKYTYGPSGGYLTAGTTTALSERVATMQSHASGNKTVEADYAAKNSGTNYFRYYRYAANGSVGASYAATAFYVRQIDFNSQGGSAVDSQLVWTTQDADSTSTQVQCAVTRPDDPTRAGYTFDGWYTDAACTDGKEFDFSGQVRENTTLYAGWTPDVYQVTYHLTKPDGSSYTPDGGAAAYTYGQGLTLPVPEAAGYTFFGWYDNAQYDGMKYTKIGEEEIGDKNYYAFFKDMDAPVIRLDGAGNYEAGDDGWWRQKEGQQAYISAAYSDNVGVTEIWLKADGDAFIKTGYDPAVYAPTQGTYPYDSLQEGEHTYVCKAVDQAGNETVSDKMTVKFDKTAPVIGEISCEKKAADFLDWIIGKESLIVHIPVTDEVSGLKSLIYTQTTLTADGEKKEEKEVTLFGRPGEQTVDLTLDADWKGKISNIRCIDKAGNVSDSKTIGNADGGVIVEDNPPVIVITEADLTDADNPKPAAAVSGDYYTQAPTLYVSVQDADDTGITAGIKTVTYSVNGTPGTVSEDFTARLKGSFGFTIPLTGYAGVVNVTVKAVDHAGNTAAESVNVKINGKETTSNAKPDYPKDALINLSPNTAYEITLPAEGGTVYQCTTDENGHLPFILTDGVNTTDMCGKDLKIVKKGDGVNTTDSDPQTLTIAARPAAIPVDKTAWEPEIAQDAEDAVIKITIEDQDDKKKEYSTDEGRTWKDVPDDNIIKDLKPGDVMIRVKADENTPHGEETTITIDASATTITAAFDLNYAGADASAGPSKQTGLTYKSSLVKPDDPVREGYDFIAWYKENTCQHAWNFEDDGETPRNIIGDIIDKSQEGYKDRYTVVDNAITVTLYAGWRENVAPKLNAVLTDGTQEKEESKWHPELTIALTYSDNVGVTKLFVKKDDGEYEELDSSQAEAIGQDADAYAQYRYAYDGVEEGEHTYTFKAADAAGNITQTKSLTAKLDRTKPELGGADFNEGYKNLWHWIIRKDSLLITIPVTEGGSGLEAVEYTLMSADGQGAGTGGSADVKKASGGNGADYTATISIAPDFKGTIAITAKDKAGNASDTKTIGADGGGIAGVIVEDNAPVITILSDRGITDETSTQAAGTALIDDFYNTAPKLLVTVEDEGADDSAVTSGLRFISWQIDGGEESPAGADFQSAIKTSHSFTINALEGRNGSHTVTVKAKDQAGNEAEKTVTVKIKAREDTPKPAIDYVQEKLKGLVPNAKYGVGEEIITADVSGCIEIREEWFGTGIQLLKKGGDNTLDSYEAQVGLAARPTAPNVNKRSDETIKGKKDGVLAGVDTTMEYSTDDGKTWTALQEKDITDGCMENLAAGGFCIRVRASKTAPCGEQTNVGIEEGRMLRADFVSNGGGSVSPITGKSWNDTLIRPKEPVKEGYVLEGWYRDEEFKDIWHFASEQADADRLTDDITLYAKWKDSAKPGISAVLADNKDAGNWHQTLSFILTYSDNVDVTKLYVKCDDGAYTEMNTLDSTQNGINAEGNMQYELKFDDLVQGEHTYTFKARDAAGNETETGELTAKLDRTNPELGEASFNEGYKNLWHWIIRKDSLIVTIPVTEVDSGIDTVSYTLISTDGEGYQDGGTVTAEASVKKASGQSSADYTATINMASDFRGRIIIAAKDRAGNTSDTKTIGADGGGITGVIVEDNAPDITILADRFVTDTDASQPNGTDISDNYYGTAPNLLVTAADDKADGNVITSGLASISWKIDEGEEQEVNGNFADSLQSVHSFEITALAEISGRHTVTVKAIDQAGNIAVKTVIVKIKGSEVTPSPSINYEEEKIGGLKPNTVYVVNLQSVTTDDNGEIPIEEHWIETTISIYQPGDNIGTTDSDTVEVVIQGRMDKPDATINYRQERLVNLEAGAAYLIDGILMTTDASGSLAIKEEQMNGGNHSIVREGVKGKFRSEPQTLVIPTRPEAPEGITGVNASRKGAADGRLTGLDERMEYRAQDSEQWIGISQRQTQPDPNEGNPGGDEEEEGDEEDEGQTVEGLAPGEYLVRYQATDYSFVGNETRIMLSFASPKKKHDKDKNASDGKEMITEEEETGGDEGGGQPVGPQLPGKTPGDGINPAQGTMPGGQDMAEGTKPDGTKPAEGTKPGGKVPADDAKSKDDADTKGDTKPDGSTDLDFGDGTIILKSYTSVDGRIVSGLDDDRDDGTSGAKGGGASEDRNGTTGESQEGTTGGTAYQRAVGKTNKSVAILVDQGAVIVTVNNVDETSCTIQAADAVAVANAVLSGEEIMQVSQGKTIEIRIDVERIDERISQEERRSVEQGIEASRSEIPNLEIGMYFDISMFMRVDEGEWNAVSETKEPIDIIVDVPEELQGRDAVFYIARVHNGACTLLEDMDTVAETITIWTSQFSIYAIAYAADDGLSADDRCGLCHICPTFLGICYFIWLALIVLAVVLVWIILRRGRGEEEKQE